MKAIRIILRGSQRSSDHCPVSVDVEEPAARIEGMTLIDEAAGGTPVPFQVESLGSGARVHWIVESIAAEQERAYVLRRSKLDLTLTPVRVKREAPDRIAVTVGGAPFTNYIYGDSVSKPCLYPVPGPFGGGVTRAYPLEKMKDDSTDHVHHRSLYVAWGDVNGSDNWSEEEGHGRVAHRRFEATTGGPVFGRIVSHNDWVDAAGIRLMRDRQEYRIYNTPPSFRLLDATVTFTASEGDVRFGDTKEGGILSARVASSMEVKREGSRGRIETSLGALNEAETWGKRAAWCDYSGLVNGRIVGLALLDHPRNPRYPTYWHVRNYGLMTANPFGESFFVGPERDGSYVLPAGESATFRYRVLIHAGRAADGGVAGRYLDWIFPPQARTEA